MKQHLSIEKGFPSPPISVVEQRDKATLWGLASRLVSKMRGCVFLNRDFFFPPSSRRREPGSWWKIHCACSRRRWGCGWQRKTGWCRAGGFAGRTGHRDGVARLGILGVLGLGGAFVLVASPPGPQ